MPNLRSIYLMAIAAGGHNFTIKALPSTRLEGVVLLKCAVNVRLLRKIMIGQSLVIMAYRPAPAQVDAVTGSDIALPDLLASFAQSKLSLQRLMLFSSGNKSRMSNLKSFENLKTLIIPLLDLLSTPFEEAEPDTIHALLKDQLPATLKHITLRYMTSNVQTKIVIEQLAVLKMQNVLPDLDKATFNFLSAVPSSFVSATMINIDGATGELAADTTWESLPEMEKMVRKDCGKLYEDAGICMVVEQTDC